MKNLSPMKLEELTPKSCLQLSSNQTSNTASDINSVQVSSPFKVQILEDDSNLKNEDEY